MAEAPDLTPRTRINGLFQQQQDRLTRSSDELMVAAMLLRPIDEIVQSAREPLLSIAELFRLNIGRERITVLVRLDQAALFQTL